MNWTGLRLGWEPRMRSILRIMVGLLYLEHGLGKVFDFPAVANHRPFELFTLVPGAAGMIELVGGALIVLGLFTRPVAFVLSGEMAFAYFLSHAPRDFFPFLNGGDSSILFCFIFLYLSVAGGGAWGLDRLRMPRSLAGSPAGQRL